MILKITLRKAPIIDKIILKKIMGAQALPDIKTCKKAVVIELCDNEYCERK